MEKIFVSRSDIIEILKSWSDRNIITKDLWNWVNKRYLPGDTEFDDWENDDSVAGDARRYA